MCKKTSFQKLKNRADRRVGATFAHPARKCFIALHVLRTTALLTKVDLFAQKIVKKMITSALFYRRKPLLHRGLQEQPCFRSAGKQGWDNEVMLVFFDEKDLTETF